jgi:plasmid stabilization system protein ParE
MSFVVGSQAREDVAEIAEFMDGKTAGRGELFIDAVERAYAAIEAKPRMQSPADDGPPGVEAREHLVRGFRYRVVFVVAGDDVTVLSVAHVNKKPRHWHDRLPTDPE